MGVFHPDIAFASYFLATLTCAMMSREASYRFDARAVYLWSRMGFYMFLMSLMMLTKPAWEVLGIALGYRP